MDNNVLDNMGGIVTYYGNPFEPTTLNSGYNIISNNRIIHNTGGGIGLSGRNNTIIGNDISQSEVGIILAVTEYNNILQNDILENDYGIFNLVSYHTIIYRNNISQNEKLGVLEFCTSTTIILQNNFIGNGQNAYFMQPVLIRLRILKNIYHFPITRSVWNENYWERPRVIPYMIPGLISLNRGIIIDAPYTFNFFQIDWHPALKPYDISGIS